MTGYRSEDFDKYVQKFYINSISSSLGNLKTLKTNQVEVKD